jgi:hypothetical protein
MYVISSDDAKYVKPLPEAVYPNLELPTPPKVSRKVKVAKEGKEETVVLEDTPPTESNPRTPCNLERDVVGAPETSTVPPPAKGVNRILIGVPMLDIKYEFFLSFLKLWTELITSGDKRYEVMFQVAYRKPVHMAEEYLVNVARYNKCTHILFMDDDVYDVTKAMVDKLVEADKDVIGGVMYASKFPHAMCVFRRFDTSKKVIDMPSDNSMYRLYEIPCLCPKCNVGLSHWDAKFCPSCGSTVSNMVQEADLIPFALTLMKLSVFDKIKKPWFHCTNIYPTDSWFADRLLEVGLREYAHMGVRLNHAGVNDLTRPHYMQMGMAMAQSAKAVVNITPDQMAVHQQLMANKMSETEKSIKEKPAIVFNGHIAANPISEGGFTLLTHGT